MRSCQERPELAAVIILAVGEVMRALGPASRRRSRRVVHPADSALYAALEALATADRQWTDEGLRRVASALRTKNGVAR